MKTLFLRLATLAVGLVLLAVGASGQSANDAQLDAQLKKLFPSAATFSAKTGSPAHYMALSSCLTTTRLYCLMAHRESAQWLGLAG